MSQSSVGKSNAGGAVFLIVFGLVLGGFGLLALMTGLKESQSQAEPPLATIAAGSLFMAVGLMILVAGFRYRKSAKMQMAREARYPDKPWLWREDWASGRMVESRMKSLIGLGVIALVWNSIAWAATIGVYSDNTEWFVRAFVLMFPAVGLAILWWLIREIQRWMRFGNSVFELAEIPGVIGGMLGGVILTQTKVRPERGFQVSLRNIHRRVTGSGKNSSTKETVLWEQTQVVDKDALQDYHARTAIPVLFEIPYETEPSRREDVRNTYFWKLKAEAEVAGIDFEAEFEVPVFRTEASRQATAGPTGALNGSDDVSVNWEQAGVQRSEAANGVTYTFRQGRHLGAALVGLAFGAVFTGMGVVSFFMGAPLLFLIVFVAIGMLVDVVSVAFLMNRTVLTLQPSGLRVQRSGLGKALDLTIPCHQLQSIEPSVGMTVGAQQYFGLKIQSESQPDLLLSTQIKGRHAAQLVAQDLLQRAQSEKR